MSTPSSSQLLISLAGTPTTVKRSSVNISTVGNTAGTTYNSSGINIFVLGDTEPLHSALLVSLTGSDIYRPSSAKLDISLVGYGIYNSNSINIITYGSSVPHVLNLNDLTPDELNALTLGQLDVLPLDDTTWRGYPISQGIYLYIKGDGLNDGFIPSSAQLTIFVQTNPGTSSSIPIFVSGTPMIGSNLPIFVSGILGKINNTINLITKPSIGSLSRGLNIFGRGFVD